MSELIKSIALVVVLLLSVSVRESSQTGIFDRFDEFGDVNCESEMARLDNFAVSLQNSPRARGAIVFFAGNMAGGKLPKRGEAEARVERIKSYLIKRRGIPQASLVVISGGYSANFRVQLWVVPPEAGLPKPEATSPPKEIEYRKGKLVPHDYRCGI